MRPRSIRALAALLTAACGSSSGSGLFSGGHGNHPVIGAEAGTDPEPGSGGEAAAAGGGTAAGGSPVHPAGGTAGAAPKTGGGPGRGGTSGANDAGGAAGKGAGGNTGGSAGSRDTGGSTGSGGSAGEGAGGEMPGTGGSSTGATPHTVVCGATTCQVGFALTSACCVSAIPLATVCIPTLGAGCANGGAAVTCDDAADCTPGEICCVDSVGDLRITVCARECKDGLDQLCRTDDECKKGGSCVPSDVQPEYSGCK